MSDNSRVEEQLANANKEMLVSTRQDLINRLNLKNQLEIHALFQKMVDGLVGLPQTPTAFFTHFDKIICDLPLTDEEKDGFISVFTFAVRFVGLTNARSILLDEHIQ